MLCPREISEEVKYRRDEYWRRFFAPSLNNHYHKALSHGIRRCSTSLLFICSSSLFYTSRTGTAVSLDSPAASLGLRLSHASRHCFDRVCKGKTGGIRVRHAPQLRAVLEYSVHIIGFILLFRQRKEPNQSLSYSAKQQPASGPVVLPQTMMA